jgi:hypothetical protein
VIYFIEKNEDTQGKPVLCRVQKFLVQVIMVSSSNRWKGPYDVYGQKMRHKWSSLIGAVVREKTTWSYNHYAESGGGENCSFLASEGWCEKFKKLMSLHNLK